MTDADAADAPDAVAAAIAAAECPGGGAEPLATGPLGMTLLSLHQEPENTRFEDAAVGYAIVMLRHGSRVLMVHERQRGCWELPGGSIEPGETPRAAAVRELWEETGQRLPEDALHFAGFVKTVLGQHRRVLYGALFTARTDAPQPFVPNSEISAMHWRDGVEAMPEVPGPLVTPGGGQVQTVDEYLVAHYSS
ncbi:NUDIX domain-containing protein [Streptomyces sp. N2-109]|uniref:NUDIX domain-containing protein n=1 Tax=Streptomyces gossypii TaxID=2883101 RepID=A0ABT2JUT5_9ACTN|nr:NUDIX domain-containing protein [Streptomyces gossypii]MCT2591054.1 NUDIX domain-containing protein [Streptomyces gossypii]